MADPGTLRFLRKPAPVLPEHRPLYKIALVLLVLYIASRGGRSSLPRLHLFNWTLKSNVRALALMRAAEEGALRFRAWGFDPALATALRYATAEGLVEVISSGCRLTPTGEAMAKHLVNIGDILVHEVAVLQTIKKRITEAMVEDVAKTWEGS